MIHLVLPEPIQYQRTLCQALSDHFDGSFVAWFIERGDSAPTNSSENFRCEFLSEAGYRSLFRALRADLEPVLVVGGWATNAARALIIASLLRVPFFIWADHPFPRKRNLIFKHLRELYLRMLGRYANGFLACGEPTVHHLAGLGLSPEKLFNFPYWITLPRTWSPPETKEGQPLKLLAVGRLVPVKAFDVAIKAVAQANQNADHVIATLTIIGDGPERERLELLASALQTECKFSSAGQCVTFSGSLPNADIYQRMTEADALIVPSEFEPYGVVVLEAMANGRPVLASDQVVAALDRDEQNGAIFLHSAGDVGALSSQISELATRRELLAAASRAARTTAEKWPPQRAGLILSKALAATTNRVLPANTLTHESQTLR